MRRLVPLVSVCNVLVKCSFVSFSTTDNLKHYVETRDIFKHLTAGMQKNF
jgi:hypothetical protein